MADVSFWHRDLAILEKQFEGIICSKQSCIAADGALILLLSLSAKLKLMISEYALHV